MFIQNYALITTPLKNILKKSEQFVWFDEYDSTFEILKEKVASAPILVYLN